MRKIILYGPAVDRHGQFRDAGAELTVGSADDEAADISAEAADALIKSGRGVIIDPLDHDHNGRKGGAAPAKSAA